MTSSIDSPLTQSELLFLATSLANGNSVTIKSLNAADIKALWNVLWNIIAWRHERNAAQPKPKTACIISEQDGIAILGSIGISADKIVLEIMGEPLMQSILFALSGIIIIPQVGSKP